MRRLPQQRAQAQQSDYRPRGEPRQHRAECLPLRQPGRPLNADDRDRKPNAVRNRQSGPDQRSRRVMRVQRRELGRIADDRDAPEQHEREKERRCGVKHERREDAAGARGRELYERNTRAADAEPFADGIEIVFVESRPYQQALSELDLVAAGTPLSVRFAASVRSACVRNRSVRGKYGSLTLRVSTGPLAAEPTSATPAKSDWSAFWASSGTREGLAWSSLQATVP